MLAHCRGSIGAALAVNHLDRSRADVYDLREQGCVLAASLASGSEARGIKLVRDEDIAEVPAGGLEAFVCLKIAHELLFAVSANAPLGGHEGAGVPGKEDSSPSQDWPVRAMRYRLSTAFVAGLTEISDLPVRELSTL